MIETITVKTLRYKTSDGTHWDTEKKKQYYMKLNVQ